MVQSLQTVPCHAVQSATFRFPARTDPCLLLLAAELAAAGEMGRLGDWANCWLHVESCLPSDERIHHASPGDL